MGLDMYAMTMTMTPAPDVEVDFAMRDQDTELHYWRKHPNLHGWMQRLYEEKGGTDASFNCVAMVLSNADLDRLEAAIQHEGLPTTEGFFFGQSDGTEKPDDLQFVERARQAIEAGLTVYYYAWW